MKKVYEIFVRGNTNLTSTNVTTKKYMYSNLKHEPGLSTECGVRMFGVSVTSGITILWSMVKCMCPQLFLSTKAGEVTFPQRIEAHY